MDLVAIIIRSEIDEFKSKSNEAKESKEEDPEEGVISRHQSTGEMETSSTFGHTTLGLRGSPTKLADLEARLSGTDNAYSGLRTKVNNALTQLYGDGITTLPSLQTSR